MTKAICGNCSIEFEDTAERITARRQEFGDGILCDGCRDAESTKESEHPNPVGKCPRCGALWYSTSGYCGGCL